jgi:hypothetical protein
MLKRFGWKSARLILAAAAVAAVCRSSLAATDGGSPLLSAVGTSGGDFTPAVRKAFLDRALADAQHAGGDAATWDWLAHHPQLRDGLLSVAYPLPSVYLQNLTVLRRELGTTIVQKYPQLVLAMAIRPTPVDAATDGTSHGDDPDSAVEKATPVDPRVTTLVNVLRRSGKTVLDLDKADASFYQKLGLKPPANDGQKNGLLNAVALASGTYPPRQHQTAAAFVKQLVAEYETKLPHFTTGPQWPLFPLDAAPWPLLLPLRATPAPDEMRWVWNHFRDDPSATPHDVPMPAGKRLMTYGHYTFDYDKPEVRLMASAWNPDALPRIVQDGGVCGRLSSLAQFSYTSLGRPAMGMYQPGHRALVAYSFAPNVGYTAERLQGITTAIKTTTGWFLPLPQGLPRASGPKNPRVGIEYQLGLALAMNVGVDKYVDTRMAVLIANQIPDGDRAIKLKLLQSVAKENPFNTEVWYALAKATGADNGPILTAIDRLVGHRDGAGGDTELAANTDLGKVRHQGKSNAAAKDAADMASVLHATIAGTTALSDAK